MSAKRFLIAAFLSASAFAGADVHIDESIPYRDKEEIDNRIVSECLEVGSIMSESLQESAAKSACFRSKCDRGFATNYRLRYQW